MIFFDKIKKIKNIAEIDGVQKMWYDNMITKQKMRLD